MNLKNQSLSTIFVFLFYSASAFCAVYKQLEEVRLDLIHRENHSSESRIDASKKACELLLIGAKDYFVKDRFSVYPRASGVYLHSDLARSELFQDFGPRELARELSKEDSKNSKTYTALPTSAEWRAAVRFGQYFHQNKNLDLVFIPHIQNLPIPGFDGVFIDEQKDIRYNLSIKNLFRENIIDQLEMAERKAWRYSWLEAWTEVYFRNDVKGKFKARWFFEGTAIFKPAKEGLRPSAYFILIYIENESKLSINDASRQTQVFLKGVEPFRRDLIKGVALVKGSEIRIEEPL